jgi:hypothetical protein
VKAFAVLQLSLNLISSYGEAQASSHCHIPNVETDRAGRHRSALSSTRIEMTKMFHAAALSATALLGAAGVASAQPVPMHPPAAQAEATQPPHYEWQYHYAGHDHPEYQGYWALVK